MHRTRAMAILHLVVTRKNVKVGRVVTSRGGKSTSDGRTVNGKPEAPKKEHLHMPMIKLSDQLRPFKIPRNKGSKTTVGQGQYVQPSVNMEPHH